MTMLAKLFGIVLLVIGGVMVFAVLMVLLGILIFALKVAAAIALIYLGYRLLTRYRHRTPY